MKIFSCIFVTVVLFLLMFLGWKIYRKAIQKRNLADKIAKLPELNFISAKTKSVAPYSVSVRPLWLIFFNTECDYCRMEASDIRGNSSLAKLNVWLVSSEPPDILQQFGRQYGLDTLNYVSILNDTTDAAGRVFNARSAPSSFLYDQEGKLIKSYTGLIKSEAVVRDLLRGGVR